jgi:L-amino acid N-acyltransferase
MEIRNATQKDINEIMNLYNYKIEKTTYIWQREPRGRRYYKNWANSHDERHPIFVLSLSGKFIGFASLSPFRNVDGYDRICEKRKHKIS